MKFTKATCEKYTLKFNDGWDYAVFTIDETGIFQCHSSFGTYSYHWGAFGDNFKKFLCEIDSYYLINKIANKDYFDFGNYLEKAKNEIIKLRKDRELNKQHARELWEFITEDLDEYSDSYDLLCSAIYNNSILSDLYSGDVFYSEFNPEQDYSLNARAFVHNIFPKFTEILKQELKNENKSA